MADSITQTGSIPFFPLEPNWATLPKSAVIMGRSIQVKEGTVDRIDTFTDDAPVKVEMGFTITSKEDEYSLIDFFNNRKGMYERFWITWPRNQFDLIRNHSSGDTVLECEYNKAELQYQGYERIEIMMNNGDKIIRQVTTVTANDAETQVNLSLDTSIDRDIGTTDYLKIARLLLVRFDTDTFTFRTETDTISELMIPFMELVNEYSEV